MPVQATMWIGATVISASSRSSLKRDHQRVRSKDLSACASTSSAPRALSSSLPPGTGRETNSAMRRRSVRRRGRSSAINTRPVISAQSAATNNIPAGERQNRSARD